MDLIKLTVASVDVVSGAILAKHLDDVGLHTWEEQGRHNNQVKLAGREATLT